MAKKLVSKVHYFDFTIFFRDPLRMVQHHLLCNEQCAWLNVLSAKTSTCGDLSESINSQKSQFQT